MGVPLTPISLRNSSNKARPKMENFNAFALRELSSFAVNWLIIDIITKDIIKNVFFSFSLFMKSLINDTDL